MGQPKDPAFKSLLNGRLPSTLLAPVQGGNHKLWPDAANAWNSLVAAAAADGVAITITDSYRTFEEQVDCARRKGLTSQGGLCATPGNSNHGWGLAVDADVNAPERANWLRANAARFGFARTVAKEPWHYEYIPLSGSRTVNEADGTPVTVTDPASLTGSSYRPLSLRSSESIGPGDLIDGAIGAVGGFLELGPIGALNGAVTGVFGSPLGALGNIVRSPLDSLGDTLVKLTAYVIPSIAGLALMILGLQQAVAATASKRILQSIAP